MIYELIITILLALSLAYVLRLIWLELRPNVVEFDESILDGIDWSVPDNAEWIKIDDEWQ